MSHFRADGGYQPTCVVAGAGPGLGLAIAERYASEVFLSYVLLRRPLRVAPMVQALRTHGLDVVSMTYDVSSVPSVQRALRAIKRHSGRCDVLIYNAYAPSFGRGSFRANVAGALAFVNGTVQEMRERNNGALLFSGCGVALRALVHCVADDVEAHGIRVGMVTIDGIMQTQAHELRKIAELYWEFFATDACGGNREVRFPVNMFTSFPNVEESK